MDHITIEDHSYTAHHIPSNNANILIIQGKKGFLACGYFSVETANKLKEAVAIVTGVKNYNDMFNAKICSISNEAEKLGIQLGQSGKEALLKLA